MSCHWSRNVAMAFDIDVHISRVTWPFLETLEVRFFSSRINFYPWNWCVKEIKHLTQTCTVNQLSTYTQKVGYKWLVRVPLTFPTPPHFRIKAILKDNSFKTLFLLEYPFFWRKKNYWKEPYFGKKICSWETKVFPCSCCELTARFWSLNFIF
jgi:hypothetical protein